MLHPAHSALRPLKRLSQPSTDTIRCTGPPSTNGSVCSQITAVEANEVQDRKKRSRSKKALGKGVLFPRFVGLKNKERTKNWVLTRSAPSWKTKKKQGDTEISVSPCPSYRRMILFMITCRADEDAAWEAAASEAQAGTDCGTRDPRG